MFSRISSLVPRLWTTAPVTFENRISNAMMDCQRNFIRKAKVVEKKISAGKILKAAKAELAAKRLSKKDMKNFPGNIKWYYANQGKPEFHNVKRNKHDYVIEPNHKFRLIVTNTVNNTHIVLQNMSRNYRAVFRSYCGMVGIRGNLKKQGTSCRRVAASVARKMKRLGVSHADVTFRRTFRMHDVLDSFQTNGVIVTSLSHQPQLAKGPIPKPRKRRII